MFETLPAGTELRVWGTPPDERDGRDKILRGGVASTCGLGEVGYGEFPSLSRCLPALAYSTRFSSH